MSHVLHLSAQLPFEWSRIGVCAPDLLKNTDTVHRGFFHRLLEQKLTLLQILVLYGLLATH